MSTTRVNWTCPGCNRLYSVPTTDGLFLCPTCLGGSDIRHPIPKTSRTTHGASPPPLPDKATPSSVQATVKKTAGLSVRIQPAKLPVLPILAVAIVSFALGFWFAQSRSNLTQSESIASANPPIDQPRDPGLTSQARKLVNRWLTANLRDGNWEEIGWYPPLMIKGHHICGVKLRTHFPGGIKTVEFKWFRCEVDRVTPVQSPALTQHDYEEASKKQLQ